MQADLRTFMAFGVYGLSAITAVTIQNTTGVSAIHDLSEQVVADQIVSMILDIPPDAVKTGMLYSGRIVEAVEDALGGLDVPIVVDPVFSSSMGQSLMADDGVSSMLRFISRAKLVTPNLMEASALTGTRVEDLATMRQAAMAMVRAGAGAALITGGHLEGPPVDVLFDGDRFNEFENKRIDAPNSHGTGCTLSAAITASLAKGKDLVTSITEARAFVRDALQAGLDIGYGSGPVNQGWRLDR